LRTSGLSQPAIVLLVAFILILALTGLYWIQRLAEQEPLYRHPDVTNFTAQRQVDKLIAEIRRIRSETIGGLFWLKVLGVLVTVGGAVGGYLVAQDRATRARLDFEHRKDVDQAYQVIVQELSSKDSPLVRAAAAVKLGALLQDFPSEWHVSPERQNQLIHLTKQVLAAALAIEEDPKVLKTLTIAIALHRPRKNDVTASEEERRLGDLRGLDLSGAKAADAYWARIDFSPRADFYRADLSQASFRQAILCEAQFRETNLKKAVLVATDCTKANFKQADLRGADLSQAHLIGVNFENAKVYGVLLAGAILRDNLEGWVDLSPDGDGSKIVSVKEWLSSNTSQTGQDTLPHLPLVVEQ